MAGKTTGIGRVSNFLIFSEVKHTADFDPLTLPSVLSFPSSVVEFAAMNLLSLGVILSTDTASISDNGGVHYTLGAHGAQKWWNGSAWVASNGTYAEANTPAEVSAHIATLYAAITPTTAVRLTAYFSTSPTQEIITAATIGYTGQLYFVGSAIIDAHAAIVSEGLQGFTVVSTEVPFDSVITYVFQLNSTRWLWWDGGAWSTSDGTSAQSNVLIDIMTNIATFPAEQTAVKIRAVVTNYNPQTTPVLNSIAIDYDFGGNIPDVIDTCIVWGYMLDEKGAPIVGSSVKVNLKPTLVQYKTSTIFINRTRTAVTDSNGYWELVVADTVGMTTAEAHYEFALGGKAFKRLVPKVAEAAFYDLPPFLG